MNNIDENINNITEKEKDEVIKDLVNKLGKMENKMNNQKNIFEKLENKLTILIKYTKKSFYIKVFFFCVFIFTFIFGIIDGLNTEFSEKTS